MVHSLKKNVYFESVRVNTINLTKARYEWLFLHWDSVDHLEFDDAAYQTLINNYKRLKWLKDSYYCHSAYTSESSSKAARNHSWIINAVESIILGNRPLGKSS